jgi:hypothetical protein
LHFWFSALGTLVLSVGIIALANITKDAAIQERGIAKIAVVGTFLGLAVLLGAQVVFIANLLFGIFRTTRTP